MTNLSEILRRLRIGASFNSIHNELGTHRTTIRSLYALAQSQDWLNPLTPLPDESTIQQKHYQAGKPNPKGKILSNFLSELKRWYVEEKKSFVVIHTLLSERLEEGVTISETTLRNFLHTTFPDTPRTVQIRSHDYGELEIDFGFFGIVYDPRERRNRKAWFLSARFAASRFAYRQMLYRTDVQTVTHALMHSFLFFDGVPRILILDNFKAAVQRADTHDPTITKVFYEFAKYYGILLSPCKVRTPEHKGGVESDVKYVKGNFWPLFREHEHTRGHDIPYADALQKELDEWSEHTANCRMLKPARVSPKELFSEEHLSLQGMPMERFDIHDWRQIIVRSDHHIWYDNNQYSVPYRFIGKKIQLCAKSCEIQLFFDNSLVARHTRLIGRGKRSTVQEHCRPDAAEYMYLTRTRALEQARTMGESIGAVCEILLADTVIDRLRSARGIIFMKRNYPVQRIEKACARALRYDLPSYASVKRILEQNLDLLPEESPMDSKGQTFLYARTADAYTTHSL